MTIGITVLLLLRQDALPLYQISQIIGKTRPPFGTCQAWLYCVGSAGQSPVFETGAGLIDLLVPYFKAGLENHEFCLWVTSDPLDEKDARKAMRQAVSHFDRYVHAGQIDWLSVLRKAACPLFLWSLGGDSSGTARKQLK